MKAYYNALRLVFHLISLPSQRKKGRREVSSWLQLKASILVRPCSNPGPMGPSGPRSPRPGAPFSPFSYFLPCKNLCRVLLEALVCPTSRRAVFGALTADQFGQDLCARNQTSSFAVIDVAVVYRAVDAIICNSGQDDTVGHVASANKPSKCAHNRSSQSIALMAIFATPPSKASVGKPRYGTYSMVLCCTLRPKFADWRFRPQTEGLR